MDMHKEKELDDLIRKVVVEAGVEEPDPAMKSGIMKALSHKYSKVVYTALIPERAWLILVCILLLFTGFVWYNPLDLQAMDIDLFSWGVFSFSWDVSPVVFYGVVGFGLMVGLQVLLLKRRIDRS